MSHRKVTLDDPLVLEQGEVLMSGIEALVRLPVQQARLDRLAGLNTGGFISGYRGSPIGGYDKQLDRARDHLHQLNIHFQPGVNEDLAATAVWGSQQVNLHPGARVDGVFAIWYGKAPGVDRSGDVFKHANMTGTWPTGGVLAVAGDDPLAKSSTLPCQSEFAFIDAEIPVLAPSGVQDVLDLGLHGIAMSRFSGLWSGMIALADIMDGSATVRLDSTRFAPVLPPDDGAPRHITLASLKLPDRLEAERRMRHHKLPAAIAYGRFNRLNRIEAEADNPALGLVASGKNWQALRAALDLLGIDDAMVAALKLRLIKIAMPWPLDPASAIELTRGLRTVLVIEAKRPLIEAQLKDHLYHLVPGRRPAVLGKKDKSGAPLLPDTGDLDPLELAKIILDRIIDDGLGDHPQTMAMKARLEQSARLRSLGVQSASGSQRTPHFCSGCPHSRSTLVPTGSRAMAGIGCHIMAQWMGRSDDAYSQMGGEGVAWIGQLPFTQTSHVFVNLGDGTYYHSGSLAIRAAVAAKARVTYKILYNDAVAMTGGQAVDGPLSVAAITHQAAAEGVQRIAVVAEDPGHHDPAGFAPGTTLHARAELMTVQQELQAWPSVSLLIFDQTCAAEKRRRRKRGLAPTPKTRLFINDRVCEGCGDCSARSNCLSVEPLATPFGQKRQINQSSCNLDKSCADGFCPSFIEIENAVLRRPDALNDQVTALAADLPAPRGDRLDAPFNILISGVGGTGVTTLSAVLAMAAHIDRRTVTALDVTGLAQKGGAVVSFLRIAPQDTDLAGARFLPGEADAVIACDLVVAAGKDCVPFCSPARSHAVADQAIAPTAEFVLQQTESYRMDDLAGHLGQRVNDLAVHNVTALAIELLGDALFANMMLAGVAFQRGILPLSLAAIEGAIRLNGAAVDKNLAAFGAGRLLEAAPDRLPSAAPANPASEDDASMPLDDLVERFSSELVAYQDQAYAARYRQLVARARLIARTVGADPNERLGRAIARNLFKLMAYKDEYEVARLHVDAGVKARLTKLFEGKPRLSVWLAPPLLARMDPATGRPKKIRFGGWIFKLFALLARMKRLRGTLFDPFGHTRERRTERALIQAYEATIDHLLAALAPANLDLAIAIAEIPQAIRGFGPVKQQNLQAARQIEARLLARFDNPDSWTPPGSGDHAFAIAAE